ncbi:MAG: hypothetical protein IKY84_03035 [Bacteroidaceae bacterium]|nr:hypothetical protein [Bacteroidaceae bacterium]
MAKLKEIPIKDTGAHLKELQGVFKLLAKNDVYKGESGFSADKDAILKVFEITRQETKADILIRLTLIDSMYSTQMSRRYYALDELAEFLVGLSEGKQGKLRQMFLNFAKDPVKNNRLFNYNKSNLFSESYGIGKDGSDKGVAISLISKYAYFETNFQFPIYDSIACEMYPLVWINCGFDKKSMPKLIHSENGKVVGDTTLIEYTKAINLLIEKLDCKELNYDLLDRFLWFVGKIRRGNLSLVLSREEYELTMKKYPAKIVTTTLKNGKEKTSMEYFNIEQVDVQKLSYLKKNSLLMKFFELAQSYGKK